MRSLIITVLMLLVFAAPVQAVQLVNPDGSVAQPFQTWADASRVPTVKGRVAIATNPTICEGHRACTSAKHGSTPPTIWVTDPTALPMDRYTLMHELGHQYDFAMPEWKRAVLRRIVQLPDTPWYVDRPHVKQSLSELFADLYAECATARRAGAMLFTLDDGEFQEVSARHMRRVCRLIRQPN